MKIIHSLSRMAGYFATIVLGLMMLLTVADVFLRYFFNSPITGATEMTEFMLVIVVFPALAWCAISGMHVKVDLLMDLFPLRIQRIVDLITLATTLFIFSIITWQSCLEAQFVDTTTSLLLVPVAPFYWVLTAGLGLFCLVIAAMLIDNFIKEIRR